jgi:predicted ester cyclase
VCHQQQEENMTTPSIDDRVTHGAALLDLTVDGWFEELDIEQLDMSGTTTDIHALITGSANLVSYDIEDITKQFQVGLSIQGEETYDELDDAWRRAVTARRERLGSVSNL